jgi:ATPase subunit of ABC transporter with duplicated ATPase domains
MLTTHRLAKSYGARSLFSEVSLELAAGCRYGLVGANGSGKSTRMNILLGRETASESCGQIAKSRSSRSKANRDRSRRNQSRHDLIDDTINQIRLKHSRASEL